MSSNSTDSWKTETFRKSVIHKLNQELAVYRLKQIDPGRDIERAIIEKGVSKRQYLGYVGKLILKFRHMVCMDEIWLQNIVNEVLSKPPPRLRRVLTPEEMAKYNVEMMKLRSELQKKSILRMKK